MTVLPLRERNKQRIRERILGAAAELFQEQGYSQTTLEAIADRAEVSRTTLFNYFPGKEVLFVVFAQEIFQARILPKMTPFLDQRRSAFEAFRLLFMNIYENVLTIPDIEQAFRQEFQQHPALSAAGLAHAAGFFDGLTLLVRYGQQRGEIRSDIPPERQAQYIGAIYFSIFQGLIFQIAASAYAAEIDRMLGFLQTGMRPVSPPPQSDSVYV